MQDPPLRILRAPLTTAMLSLAAPFLAAQETAAAIGTAEAAEATVAAAGCPVRRRYRRACPDPGQGQESLLLRRIAARGRHRQEVPEEIRCIRQEVPGISPLPLPGGGGGVWSIAAALALAMRSAFIDPERSMTRDR